MGEDQLAAKVNALGGLVALLGQNASQEDADALRDAFNVVGAEVCHCHCRGLQCAVKLLGAMQPRGVAVESPREAAAGL